MNNKLKKMIDFSIGSKQGDRHLINLYKKDTLDREREELKKEKIRNSHSVANLNKKNKMDKSDFNNSIALDSSFKLNTTSTLTKNTKNSLKASKSVAQKLIINEKLYKTEAGEKKNPHFPFRIGTNAVDKKSSECTSPLFNNTVKEIKEIDLSTSIVGKHKRSSSQQKKPLHSKNQSSIIKKILNKSDLEKPYATDLSIFKKNSANNAKNSKRIYHSHSNTAAHPNKQSQKKAIQTINSYAFSSATPEPSKPNRSYYNKSAADIFNKINSKEKDIRDNYLNFHNNNHSRAHSQNQNHSAHSQQRKSHNKPNYILEKFDKNYNQVIRTQKENQAVNDYDSYERKYNEAAGSYGNDKKLIVSANNSYIHNINISQISQVSHSPNSLECNTRYGDPDQDHDVVFDKIDKFDNSKYEKPILSNSLNNTHIKNTKSLNLTEHSDLLNDNSTAIPISGVKLSAGKKDMKAGLNPNKKLHQIHQIHQKSLHGVEDEKCKAHNMKVRFEQALNLVLGNQEYFQHEKERDNQTDVSYNFKNRTHKFQKSPTALSQSKNLNDFQIGYRHSPSDNHNERISYSNLLDSENNLNTTSSNMPGFSANGSLITSLGGSLMNSAITSAAASRYKLSSSQHIRSEGLHPQNSQNRNYEDKNTFPKDDVDEKEEEKKNQGKTHHMQSHSQANSKYITNPAFHNNNKGVYQSENFRNNTKKFKQRKKSDDKIQKESDEREGQHLKRREERSPLPVRELKLSIFNKFLTEIMDNSQYREVLHLIKDGYTHIIHSLLNENRILKLHQPTQTQKQKEKDKENHELKEKETQITELRKDVKKWKESCERKDEKLMVLRKEKDSASKECDNHTKLLRDKNINIKDLNKSLCDCRNELQEMKKKEKAKEDNCNDLQMDKLMGEINLLYKENYRLTKIIKKLHSESKQAKQRELTMISLLKGTPDALQHRHPDRHSSKPPVINSHQHQNQLQQEEEDEGLADKSLNKSVKIGEEKGERASYPLGALGKCKIGVKIPKLDLSKLKAKEGKVEGKGGYGYVSKVQNPLHVLPAPLNQSESQSVKQNKAMVDDTDEGVHQQSNPYKPHIKNSQHIHSQSYSFNKQVLKDASNLKLEKKPMGGGDKNKPFVAIPALNLNSLKNKNGQNDKYQKTDVNALSEVGKAENEKKERIVPAFNLQNVPKGVDKVPAFNLQNNMNNNQPPNQIQDYHDEFMAKYDEFSPSWREALIKEKRY